jgi:hypothetical protein
VRAHFITKPTALAVATNHFWRLQRSSDNWYWNDATGAWQAGVANMVLNTTPATAPLESFSRPIAAANGVTYTVSVWVVNTAGAEAMVVYYATLYFAAAAGGVDFVPTPVVTTTASSTTVGDAITIANPTSARSWNPLQGTALLRVRIAWDHSSLADGAIKAFHSQKIDPNNRDLLYYIRDSATAGRLIFQRYVNGSSFAATINVTTTSGPGSTSELPQQGDVLALACRWQETGGELGGANYAFFLTVVGLHAGTTLKTASATGAANASLGNSTIYLGDNSSAGQFVCGALRDLEVVPYVLPEAEIYRRLGV